MKIASGSARTARMGRPVSRNLSMAKSCLPLAERVLAPSTFQTWLWYPLNGVRTPRCGVAKVVKFCRSVNSVRSCSSRGYAYHRLDLLKDALVVEQSNCVSCDQASKRISSDAELRDFVTLLPQLLESCLDLVCNPLATNLGAIVREAAGVALGN